MLAFGGVLAAVGAAPISAADEDEIIPVLRSGQATGDLNGSPFSLPYTDTPLGTLIALQPILARIGGELAIGPLGQSHKLTLGGTTYVFGPDSAAVTFDEEIATLSQPPKIGVGGIHVPFDLLDRIYGTTLGYGFRWMPDERRLLMAQRQLRSIPLAVELVNLQGVSTLVLRFDEEPRYRIEERPGAVVVEMVGDRAALLPGQQLARDPFVRGVHVTEEEITIDLEPGADSEHYTLDDGRRLVFELFQGAAPSIELSGSQPDDDPTRRRPKRETIVIDPGHGGRDAGTQSAAGVSEKSLTLQIARSLKATLERLYPVRVVLTRDEDAYLPLETRTAIANQHDADLFLSLHLNASRGSNAHGAETYFLSLQATDESAELFAQSENALGEAQAIGDLDLILWDLAQNRHLGRSQSLAKLIQAELNERMGITNRGVKQAPFRVLMGAKMPAVLVEVGFLSNDDEARRLMTSEYQQELVAGLAEAIGRYRDQVRPPAAQQAGAQQATGTGATP